MRSHINQKGTNHSLQRCGNLSLETCLKFGYMIYTFFSREAWINKCGFARFDFFFFLNFNNVGIRNLNI